MKSFLKRYKIFLLLIIINVVVGFALRDIGLKSISITKQNFMEMISVIPPIFILLGLLDVWVDRATMIKYTGKGSGLKGVLIAFLLGSATAGPLYAAFPIAGVMLKRAVACSMLLFSSEYGQRPKIPMLTFEAASLGVTFTLTRLALSIIGILIIAATAEKALNQEQQKEIYELN